MPFGTAHRIVGRIAASGIGPGRAGRDRSGEGTGPEEQPRPAGQRGRAGAGGDGAHEQGPVAKIAAGEGRLAERRSRVERAQGELGAER